jgi:hypothetical protein
MGAHDTSLLEIIDSDTTAQRSTFDIEPSPPLGEPQAMPPRQQSLNDLFVQYKRYEQQLTNLVSLQNSLEQGMFGKTITDMPSLKCVTEIARAALDQLIYKAQRIFAPFGGTLKIDLNEVLQATGQSDYAETYRDRRWHKEQKSVPIGLDLDKVWAYIETTYGGDAGVTLGYQQQAAVIVAELRLADEDSMNRTAGYVACSTRVWSEKQTYGSQSGMYRAHYGACESLSKLFAALRCFAEWAEFGSLASALEPSRNGLGDYHHHYSLRERVSFPGLEVVMYKEKWVFQMKHEVAEKLMLFLGEFTQE